MLRFLLVTLTATATGIGAAACAPDARPASIDANQEPVAILRVGDARAREPVELDASGSLDVDGALVSAALSFGDGSPDEERSDLASLVFAHAWAEAGLYDVELTVVDDDGLEGRARIRVDVAPPPEASPPTLGALEVLLDDRVLEDGDAVAVGATLTLDVAATDPEANLESVDVEAGAAAASIALAGAEASGTGSIVVDTEGRARIYDSGLIKNFSPIAESFEDDQQTLSIGINVVSLMASAKAVKARSEQLQRQAKAGAAPGAPAGG
jgi:hypothetical protein